MNVSGDGADKSGEYQKIIEGLTEKKIAFLSSKSIFLFDLDKASKEILNKFPQIQNISIQRKFPAQIYASVQERKPAAVFHWRGEKYFLIDETGVIFEEVGQPDGFFEILKSDEPNDAKLGSRIFDTAFLVKILRFKADIENKMPVKISRGLVVTDERVNFTTTEGWEIFVNPQKDMDWQFTKLEAVVNDASFAQKRGNLEYVDLRFTRVYLKSKQAAQTIEVDPRPSKVQTEIKQTPVAPGAPLN
ncbi:MAG: FtsQ-type POTRA domain-containing protein [Candidatus Nealsonbacteria bacterium]|nr:FtsQ-type POTRA domain-containing protein [Candidatus Nealsonbacteria bacterium]